MGEFLIFFIGIVAGAVGYLIATFWMRPILRYLDIKDRVVADIVFYANAIMVEGDAIVVPEMRQARTESNRRNSAELVACYLRLPWFYKRLLSTRIEDPISAARELIGLANSSKGDNADRHLVNLKHYLKIPSEVGN